MTAASPTDASPDAPAPALAFAFAIHLRFTPPQIVKSRQLGTERAGVYVLDGRFEGPRIRGTVVPGSGGDFAQLRPDGVLDFDARYMLQADDGTPIYLQSRGFRHSTPEVAARLQRGEPVDPSEYYLRVATRFEVEAGPHDWLARHVFVGSGERVPGGNLIRYWCVQ